MGGRRRLTGEASRSATMGTGAPMALTSKLARPMLAALFVSFGADAVMNPEPKAETSDEVGPRVAAPLGLPTDPETLVKINGSVQVVAGLLLALGRFPRLSAFLLAGSLVPTTLAGHAFWDEDEPAARKSQRMHFMKNLAVLGGLLLASGDTEGNPSVAWRAKRGVDRATHRVADVLPDRG